MPSIHKNSDLCTPCVKPIHACIGACIDIEKEPVIFLISNMIQMFVNCRFFACIAITKGDEAS